MSTSNTLTKNDLKKVLEKLSIGSGGDGALVDMTAQEIEDFVNTIDAQGANLVDYVVAEGVEGIWTWRKWNSGAAECWGTWSGSLTHYGTSFGGYAFYTTVNFPSNFFISAPVVTYSAQVGSSFGLTGTQLTSDKDYTNCYAISGASGTQAVRFILDCKGRWK
jgi:hypothetical protein